MENNLSKKNGFFPEISMKKSILAKNRNGLIYLLGNFLNFDSMVIRFCYQLHVVEMTYFNFLMKFPVLERENPSKKTFYVGIKFYFDEPSYISKSLTVSSLYLLKRFRVLRFHCLKISVSLFKK
jgi:hypothetical protein